MMRQDLLCHFIITGRILTTQIYGAETIMKYFYFFLFSENHSIFMGKRVRERRRKLILAKSSRLNNQRSPLSKLPRERESLVLFVSSQSLIR